MSYKQQHESFVSGNQGTTALHIAVTGVACLLPVYLRDAIFTILPPQLKQKIQESSWLGFVMDFILVIVPVQLIMTVFSDRAAHCLFVLTMMLWIVFNLKLRKDNMKSIRQSVSVNDIKMENKRPFISYYRAFANVITAFSILAVDFKIFPRYFAKTETFGTGLMDVGLGGFLITNAVVSPEARGIVTSDRIPAAVWKSVKSSLPLILLGSVRILAVKSLDYQEHVSEYGVHWNFFFSLAVVKIGCTLLFCGLTPRLWNVIGVLTIAIYQHSLTYDGLKDYIINGADGKGGRVDLIDANREGLYSCIGLLSTYIMGVQLGKIIMRKREKVSDWMKLAITLMFLSGASWLLMYFCGKHVERVSRRFANLTYLLWMLAFNSMLLFVFLVFDVALSCFNHVCRLEHKKDGGAGDAEESTPDVGYSTCDLISAINYNGLFYFLFANLLTGLVNMCVKTVYQSNIVAMAILMCYMFVLSLVTNILYKKKICLKFW